MKRKHSTHKIAPFTSLVILLLVSMACGISNSPALVATSAPSDNSGSEPAATEAPIVVEESAPESPINLSPIAIESSDPSGGWIYHNVYFAFENQSTQWLPVTLDSGQGVVETQEGFNYNGDPIRYSSMIPLLYGEPISIPPGFRIVGSTDNYNGFENVFQFQFSSADTTTPLKINFANYGAIDLVNIPKASLNDVIMSRIAAGDYPFPTDQPRTSFSNIGDSIEIPNQAKLTFLQAYPSEYGVFAGVTVDIEIQNLNPGYDTTVNAGCYMIDGMGFIRWNKEDTRFYAGPGQTNTTKLGFYLWNPSKAFYGDNALDSVTRDAVLSNAKLICRGDFEAIFNLDVR